MPMHREVIKLNKELAPYLGYKYNKERDGFHTPMKTLNKIENLPNWAGNLNDCNDAERELIWHDDCLVERYEENLKYVYTKAVGYQAAGYWFMAPPGIRVMALIETLKENK